MKKYKALTCEFTTKNYFKERSDSAKLFFKAYFLFDDDCKIYKQFIQLQLNEHYKIATYRHTDKKIIETKGYYSNEKVVNFRKKFLDLEHIIPSEYEYFKENLISLDEEKISKINKAFLSNEDFTKTTAKTMVSYFTGSNITGCETKWKNDPLPIVNCKNERYNCANLFNVVTKYMQKTKSQLDKSNNIKINNLAEIQEYSIDDFMELSACFKEIFSDVNKRYFIWVDNVDEQDVKNYISDGEYQQLKSKNIKKKPGPFQSMDEYYSFVNQMLFSGSINLANMENNRIKYLLRQYFIKSCDYAEKLLIYDYLYSVLQDCGAEPERAHIVSCATLVKRINETNDIKEKNKIFLYGIKHLNCLNITPNLHKKYDKWIITIDPNDGRILFIKTNDYSKYNVLNKNELKDKQEYLWDNWKYFQKHKRNL